MTEHFRITVTSVADLSPSLIRLVFAVEGMEALRGTPHPDEWVSLWFPDDRGDLPVPSAGMFGRRLPRARSRPYTLRKLDPAAGTVTIDVVRHAGGLAATWAARARPGEQLLMGQPEGRFAPRPGTRRVLIFADLTGLPAVARIIEQQADAASLLAHIVLPCPQDQLTAPDSRSCDLHWHHAPLSDPGWLVSQAAATGFRPGRDYIWVAAEAATVAGVKRLFRAKGAQAADITAIGYWILGQSRR